MKVSKAMKKLKFWSRKKKRKTSPLLEQSPPPLLPCYYHCPFYPVQPSAPPLPPCFDYEEASVTHVQPEPTPSNNTGFTLPQPQEVSNAVYGLPVTAEQAGTERAAGGFGCVINFGAHLFRCFFPCFHIRELNISHHNNSHFLQ